MDVITTVLKADCILNFENVTIMPGKKLYIQVFLDSRDTNITLEEREITNYEITREKNLDCIEKEILDAEFADIVGV